ncbi:MAG: ABC transporter substrate-binding protein [Chloroflexi bacterium]|nr:ABC transporter substrate-binding protein [Chloroflexota bacterium]
MKYSKVVLIIIVLIASIITPTYAQGADDTYKVALLLWSDPTGFKAKMLEYGYVEGENLTYLSLDMQDVAMEDWQAEYQKQVQSMVDEGVDVFVTETDTDAVNLRALVGTEIPIVFARSDDPVATGAVTDLVNPGGNVTGNITNKPHERRLQLLTEIDPTTKKIYYISSSYALGVDVTLQQVQAVADKLGVEVVTAQLSETMTGLQVVQNIPEDADWVFITPFVFFDPESNQMLMTFCTEHQIGIAGITDDPVPGYVVGYGPSVNDSNGQAAQLVDRILRGASPADLPVQTAENFLTINLEAAAAINMTIPEAILRQANTIVRPGYFESLATEAPNN